MEPRARTTSRNEAGGGTFPDGRVDLEGRELEGRELEGRGLEGRGVEGRGVEGRGEPDGTGLPPDAAAASAGRGQEPAVAAVAPDWRAWLTGSPREVLARIVPGDPLGVRDAVALALRAECVFLDADRVHLRALALVARGAARYRGRPELATWLAAESTRAVAAILREDADARREADGAFAQLARPLGLDPEALRRGCATFNRLPAADRAAFFALAIWNRRLDDLVRESGESATEIARRARRGLDAVMLALQPEPAPPARPTSAARPARSEERP